MIKKKRMKFAKSEGIAKGEKQEKILMKIKNKINLTKGEV